MSGARDGRLVLGIETSCDETAAAVVEEGRFVHSSVVASQVELHAAYGGVVPEVAGRAHVELLDDVVAAALLEAGLDVHEVDAVAATHGPGLAGALLVGVSAAKAIALATGRPYVGVNHLEAHLCAAWIEDPDLAEPFAALVASGGHTMVVLVDAPTRHRLLGQTVDDAAGEAFDKVARMLGLGYPGGPAVERMAEQGDPQAVAFPRPMLDEGFDFSFSGLKTAVAVHLRRHPDADAADVAASFQEAVVDVLVAKLLAAAEAGRVSTLVIGGGVAANARLRERVTAAAGASGRRALVPPRAHCTDNAAMIAATGHWRLSADGPTPLDTGADPNLALDEPAPRRATWHGAGGVGMVR